MKSTIKLSQINWSHTTCANTSSSTSAVLLPAGADANDCIIFVWNSSNTEISLYLKSVIFLSTKIWITLNELRQWMKRSDKWELKTNNDWIYISSLSLAVICTFLLSNHGYLCFDISLTMEHTLSHILYKDTTWVNENYLVHNLNGWQMTIKGKYRSFLPSNINKPLKWYFYIG